ncbi:MAG: hypothetical protein C0403_04355 [Desulfobacterium sp.]|nr:hypothetical protein [Desulfobacterium sp.]
MICIFIDKNAIIMYEHCLRADNYLLLVTTCYLIITQQKKSVIHERHLRENRFLKVHETNETNETNEIISFSNKT